MSDFFGRDNVSVFPSTYRKYIPNGKFTSEQNFVNILNSIVDDVNSNQGSYVLDYSNNVLQVVIHGYYFEIKNLSGLTENYSNLWLGIKVQQGGYRLVNFDATTDELDSSSSFCGLMYSTSEPSNDSNDDYKVYYLKVVDNKNIVNKARFKTDSIQFDSSHSLTSELGEKQYRLFCGNGIDTISNNQPIYNAQGEITNKNIIKLKDAEYAKLQSLNGKGNNLKPVYFDADGKAVASDYQLLGKNTATESQGIYIVNGTFTAGQTIYASTGNPTGGKVGDIWLKYSESVEG